jgi:ribosomal protein S18 acetylase RimI-like enzyme
VGVTFVSADQFSIADLAAIWRPAYEDYFVPLQFDEGEFGRHVRWSKLDLAQSVVGLVDGEPFGLSLAARDGPDAWIGGFGIAKPMRRRGLATQLIAEHMARLDAAGVERTRLEVIDVNPAREVYRAAGFVKTRELLILDGVLAPGGEPGVDLDRAALAEAHEQLHDDAPSWRRGLSRLEAILDDQPAFVLGVERDGRIAAFAAGLYLPDRFGVFDLAAEDEEAVGPLLSALAYVHPEAKIRLVDEPVDTPLARVLLKAGFTEPLRQIEMIRRR